MNIQKYILTFLRKFQAPQGLPRLAPARDWMLILFVSALVLCASVVWNTWFFFTMVNQDAVQAPVQTEGLVDTSVLERARELIQERSEEALKYKTEYQFVDPSRQGK